MGIFNQYELQKSVYQLLSADSVLMGMVAGIYDIPPQPAPYPYILLGVGQSADWSTATSSGTEHQLGVRVWSREGGRRQAALIMERVHALLHGANPAVVGHVVVSMRFAASDVTLENDGVTLLAAMRFRVLMEAA